MQHKELEEKVCLCIGKSICDTERTLLPAQSLRDDLGLTSLDFLELIFQLEKTFGLEIRRGDFYSSIQIDINDLTVKDVVDFVQLKTAGPKA